MLAVLCLAFVVLAALGMPIAFALGISSLVAMLYAGFDPIQIAGKMVHAVDSFPLMAIPLFMLAILVAGMFMESNALIVMIVPILAPMALSYGLDPVYFGFLFVMNIVLGSITPPVGILLFVVSSIWKLEISNVIRHIWPFILLLYGILILCIAVPDIFMFLPRLLGYAQ